VEAVCAEFSGVWPVNYNTPGTARGVRTGRTAETLRGKKSAKKAGGAYRWRFGGGFHSPLMDGAAEDLRRRLKKLSNRTTGFCSVGQNCSGTPYTGNPTALFKPSDHPSGALAADRFRRCLPTGVTVFIETAWARLLTKMVQRMAPEAICRSVQTPQKSNLFWEELA
jgi:[acyl-carrier-protein] S-malonyltransferase